MVSYDNSQQNCTTQDTKFEKIMTRTLDSKISFAFCQDEIRVFLRLGGDSRNQSTGQPTNFIWHQVAWLRDENSTGARA
jgi:hypothetical protein